MNDEERDAILLKLERQMVEITTVLKGYNGNEGLCDKVDQYGKAIGRLWIAVSVMSVSIGGGAYGVVQALLR